MKKPNNLPLKDYLVQITAKEHEICEETVDKVISWIYEDANKATKSFSQIEFSGFGKLLVSIPKTKRRLEKLNKMKERLESKEQNDLTTKKLSSLNKNIDFLEKKLG